MTHIRLVKLSSRRGRPKAIDDGYTVLGHYVRPPTVGESFKVFRYQRNKVRMLGVLTTSPIVSVGNTGKTFTTENSRYRMTVLVPVARKSVEKS